MDNENIILDIHSNILKYKDTTDILYLCTEYFEELDFDAIEYIFHSYFKHNYIFNKNSSKTINKTAFLNFLFFMNNNKYLFEYILNEKIISKFDLESLLKIYSLLVFYIQNDIEIKNINFLSEMKKIEMKIILLLDKGEIFHSIDSFFVFSLYSNINMKKYRASFYETFILDNKIETTNIYTKSIINFIKPGAKANINFEINLLIDIEIPIDNNLDLFFEYLFFDNKILYDDNIDYKSNDLNNKHFIFENIQNKIGYKEYIRYILNSDIRKYSFINSACPFTFEIDIDNSKLIFNKTNDKINNILLSNILSLEEKLRFLNSLDYNININQHYVFIWVIYHLNDFSDLNKLDFLKMKINNFIFNFSQGQYKKIDIISNNSEYFNNYFRKKILNLVKNNKEESKLIYNFLSRQHRIEILEALTMFAPIFKISDISKLLSSSKKFNLIKEFILNKKDNEEQKYRVSVDKINKILTLENLLKNNKIHSSFLNICIDRKEFKLFQKLVPVSVFNNNNKINKKTINFITNNINTFYMLHFDEYFIYIIHYLYNNRYIDKRLFKEFFIKSLNEKHPNSSNTLFNFLNIFIQSSKFDKEFLLDENIEWNVRFNILQYALKHTKYKEKLELTDEFINEKLLDIIEYNKSKIYFNISVIGKLVCKLGNHNTNENLKYLLINYINKYNDIGFVKKILNIATIFNIDINEKYTDEFFFLTHGVQENKVSSLFDI